MDSKHETTTADSRNASQDREHREIRGDEPRAKEADLSVLVDEVFGESRTNGVIITTGGGNNG